MMKRRRWWKFNPSRGGAGMIKFTLRNEGRWPFRGNQDQQKRICQSIERFFWPLSGCCWSAAYFSHKAAICPWTDFWCGNKEEEQLLVGKRINLRWNFKRFSILYLSNAFPIEGKFVIRRCLSLFGNLSPVCHPDLIRLATSTRFSSHRLPWWH